MIPVKQIVFVSFKEGAENGESVEPFPGEIRKVLLRLSRDELELIIQISEKDLKVEPSEMREIGFLIGEVERRSHGIDNLEDCSLMDFQRIIFILRDEGTGKLMYKVKQVGPEGNYVWTEKNYQPL